MGRPRLCCRVPARSRPPPGELQDQAIIGQQLSYRRRGLGRNVATSPIAGAAVPQPIPRRLIAGLDVAALGRGRAGLSDLDGPADRRQPPAVLVRALERGVDRSDTVDKYGSDADERPLVEVREETRSTPDAIAVLIEPAPTAHRVHDARCPPDHMAWLGR